MIDAVYINKLLLRASKRLFKVAASNEIFVSEASSPCLRKAYFDRTLTRVPSPSEALKHLGNEVHRLLQEELRADGWDVEVSVSLDLKDFILRGRVDAVKGDEVIEIKSSNGAPEAPRFSHELQLQAYLAMMRARRGYLVYIDRASGRVRVFKVVRDKACLRKVIERARTLYQALTSQRAPRPERGPWCSLCPYRQRCRPGTVLVQDAV